MAIRRKLADGKRRCGRESIVFPFQSSLFLPLFLFLMLLNKIVIIQEKPSSAESEWHQPSLRVRTDTGNDGPPEVCVSMQSYGFQTARFCISVTHGSLIPLHSTPPLKFSFGFGVFCSILAPTGTPAFVVHKFPPVSLAIHHSLPLCPHFRFGRLIPQKLSSQQPSGSLTIALSTG